MGDATLYRLYNTVTDEIESQGGRVLRVDELYSRIAHTAKDLGRKPRLSEGK